MSDKEFINILEGQLREVEEIFVDSGIIGMIGSHAWKAQVKRLIDAPDESHLQQQWLERAIKAYQFEANMQGLPQDAFDAVQKAIEKEFKD